MKPAIATDVDSWCTRCRLLLAHTVETMIGDKITRVHCNTCGAQHAYRPHPPGASGAAGERGSGSLRRRPSTRKSAVSTPTVDYEGLLRGRSPSTARGYSVTERFRSDELLTHPTFGLGVVTADKGAGKIEVFFADGPKVLVHGR